MLAQFNRRRSLTLVGALALVVATASPGAAAPGDLDPTFDGDGRVTTDFFGTEDEANGVAIQGDGKIVAAGSAVGSFTSFDFALTRYHANGTLDTIFDGDGKVTTDFVGLGDLAFAVALQGDGKIVAVGRADVSVTSFDFALARYNSNGSLDTTFDGDGKVTTDFPVGTIDEAFAVAIQGDGKIVAAGSTEVSGSDDFALARYNSDGSLDTTFDGDGKVTTDLGGLDDQAFAVAIQGDGKIVAAGYASSDDDDFALARYNSDGSLDTTFDGDGLVTTDFAIDLDRAVGVALQGDGKIVAAGVAFPGSDFALARYNTDGSLDSTFDGDGKVTTDFAGNGDRALAVAVQVNGKIAAAGASSDLTSFRDLFALVRYNPNGSLDTGFSEDGRVVTDFEGGSDQARAVAIQGDGKLVAAGCTGCVSEASDFALARYTGDTCRRTSRRTSIPCP